MKRILAFLPIMLLTLTACSSAPDNTKELEALAHNRAAVLAVGLPIEQGPVSVMSARSKGTSIELMMIYNEDAKGAKPIQQVFNQTVLSYCQNEQIKANLALGLSYQIKIRNHRGQLLVDTVISEQSCQ